MPNNRTPAEREDLAFYYAVAIQTLRYPSPDAIPDIRNALTLLNTEQAVPPLNTIARELATEFENLLLLPQDGALVEYTRLFITNYPAPACRPIEAIYREKSLVGECTEKVAAQYWRVGLESKGHPPDHILSELAFLQYVMSHEPEEHFKAEGLEMLHNDFIVNHIMQWVPAWLIDIRNFAQFPYYLKVADFLSGVFTLPQ